VVTEGLNRLMGCVKIAPDEVIMPQAADARPYTITPTLMIDPPGITGESSLVKRPRNGQEPVRPSSSAVAMRFIRSIAAAMIHDCRAIRSSAPVFVTNSPKRRNNTP
jgi:hypothetical protein